MPSLLRDFFLLQINYELFLQYDLRKRCKSMAYKQNNEMREEVRAESQNRVIDKSTLSFRAVKRSRAKLRKIRIYARYLRNY